MKIVKRMFASKEVKAILGVLDEADQKMDYRVFSVVKEKVERLVLDQPDEMDSEIKGGASPRQITYAMIANVAGDEVESGSYHVYRGMLNTLKGGDDLLRIFDAAVNELLAIGAIDADDEARHKAAIRNRIKLAE